MLETFNGWLEHWEPTWLFIVLHLEALSGWFGVMILARRLAQRQKIVYRNRKKEESFECLTQGEHK